MEIGQKVPTFIGKRVLVVEDYVLNRDLLANLLEKMNVDVDFAKNGQSALKQHEENKYDLILMDIVLPDIDGCEVARSIRKMSSPKGQVPLIAVTANALPEDREKCLKSGMNDYLVKPIKMKTLQSVLEKYFSKS